MSPLNVRPAARSAVEVLPVDALLHQELSALWLASRLESGTHPETAIRSSAEAKMVEALGRPDVMAYLARIDGAGVGYVITSENPFGLGHQSEIAIEQLFVHQHARRHGVARALLTAVLTHAERAGSDVIVSHVPATSREANRFFARLGFSSVLVRRVASTNALRRRIAPAASADAQVLRRRRSLAHPARRGASVWPVA